VLAGGLFAAELTLRDGRFEASAAPPEATLEVFVDAPGEPPPLLGASRREADKLVFEARYGLSDGMSYRVVYRSSPDAEPVSKVFEIPKRNAEPSTVLEAVYPSVDILPENLLKLYFQFSAPMSRGEAYRRIRLVDAAGKTVEAPFLELEQELWDAEGKRLTLLFDPGRVKRELVPNVEVGLALHAGRRYAIVVDAEWRDANGVPLKAAARKEFLAGEPDYDVPNPKTWKLTAPSANSREPLTVELPEPLDRALLERVVAATNFRGEPIDGSVEIDRQETRWRFTPDAPWTPGRYRLQAETILEDLAGNSIGRPFEVDDFRRVEDNAGRVTADLKFEVK